MKLIFVLTITIIVLGLIPSTFSAYCNGKPGPIHNNTQPIWRGQPQLIKTVKNGRRYEIGDTAYNNTMTLLHVYGDMYEMGYAQGELLGKELRDFINEVWDYMESQVTEVLPPWVPDWLAKEIANLGLDVVLDLTYYATVAYTTPSFYNEIKGMCDASGANYLKARNIQLLGELTKGACSMYGAWGAATVNNITMQLRALDWDFDGPFRKYPQITIYHPSSAKIGNKFANIGFSGFVGSLSGINEYHMAISEIGVSYPDDTFGKESRIGNPFTYVLRDILQFDKNLNESISRLENTRRTCDLILGVGDGLQGTFRGFQYSHSVCNVIADYNLQPNATWHPEIKNVVYFGMDWDCPSYDERFSFLLNEYYGQIDSYSTIRYIIPGLTSGNLQIVVYDLTNMNIYIAYGYKSDDGKTIINAYDKSFIQLDMNVQFNEPKPTEEEIQQI